MIFKSCHRRVIVIILVIIIILVIDNAPEVVGQWSVVVKSCQWWSARCSLTRAQLVANKMMVVVMMVMVANNVAHGGQRGAHRLEHNWWPKVAARSIIITLNVGISCHHKHQSKYQYYYCPSSSLLSIPGQKQHSPVKCITAQYFYVLSGCWKH